MRNVEGVRRLECLECVVEGLLSATAMPDSTPSDVRGLFGGLSLKSKHSGVPKLIKKIENALPLNPVLEEVFMSLSNFATAASWAPMR